MPSLRISGLVIPNRDHLDGIFYLPLTHMIDYRVKLGIKGLLFQNCVVFLSKILDLLLNTVSNHNMAEKLLTGMLTPLLPYHECCAL